MIDCSNETVNIGNIPPAILLSMKGRSQKWHIVLGELCDNSFDAGASRVEIAFGPQKTVQVIDDGCGCNNIEKMLTIGLHYKHPSTRLGRYGVGLKEAACWLWGEMILSTVYKNSLYKMAVDWNALSKQNNWNILAPKTFDSNGHIGTHLTFRNIIRGFPDYKYLQDELGWMFAPALWEGKQIVMKFSKKTAKTCAGWTLPPLTDIVQGEFNIKGKRVQLKAGIVAPDIENSRPGFNITHGHRIIMNSGWGAKGMNVLRICGIIELGPGWALGTNKNDIVDTDGEELEDAVYSLCKNILAKAGEQAEVIKNSELETKISQSLQSILLQRKKARRNSPKNNTGTVDPTDSGKKHRRSRKSQDGESILDRCNVGALRMQWLPFNDDRIGEVDLPGNVIYINSNHARMKYHRDANNTDALVDNCMTLLAFEVLDNPQRNNFPSMRAYDNFVDALSGILHSHQDTIEASKTSA